MSGGGMVSTSPEQTQPSQVTFPVTNKDPVTSLCPWPIEVVLSNDFIVTIPALPAVNWLQYLLSEDPDFVSLIYDLIPEVEDYYFDNGLPMTELYEKTLEVIGVAAGREWWVALRLTYLAVSAWHVIGPRLMVNGIDAKVVSFSGWLDALLFLVIENMDPKDTAMFAMQLEAKPLRDLFGNESEPEDPFDRMATDRSAFLAMAR